MARKVFLLLPILFFFGCIPAMQQPMRDSRTHCLKYETIEEQKVCERSMDDGIKEWNENERREIERDAYDFGRAYGPTYPY